MAANMQPSAAMPMVARKTAAASAIERGVPKNSASAGSSTASHSTSSAAAASALPAKMAAGGADVRITCSRLACSFSAANARPNASSPANTSASHSTPGAIAGALRLSIWKPKFAITSASTTNWASAGTSSRLRHSETRSLRATASATAMDLMSLHHVQARAGAHHVSLAQLDGAVPESRRERLVVRREDDRPLLHHAREQLRPLGVEAGVGLVEDEEQRVVDGRAGDREPLLQAARKLCGATPRDLREPHELQRLRHARAVDPAQVAEERQVLGRGQRRIQAWRVRQVADARSQPALLAPRVKIGRASCRERVDSAVVAG